MKPVENVQGTLALDIESSEKIAHAHSSRAPGPLAQLGDELWLALDSYELPLIALGIRPASSPPLAVSIVQGHRAHLLAVDHKAEQMGVRCGMSATAACALCPQLHIRRHDPLLEAAALQGLAAWAGRYTSRISVQAPRGLLMEIGASVRLFGGLGPLLQAIETDLQRQQHRVARGVAPTPTAAWLLACAGQVAPVSVVQHLRSRLAAVPVRYLQLPARVLDDLQAMGVTSFGDCLRLPRDGLTRRFGPALLDVMDRALGLRADPRPRWVPPTRFERRLDLAFESADRKLLMCGVELLLGELAGFLDVHGCGAGALELQLSHQGAAATRINLELVVPSKNAAHLAALLEQRVERAPIHRPVLYLGLRVTRLLALAPDTADLYRSTNSAQAGSHGAVDARLVEQRGQLLVEQLGSRLGHERVCTLSCVADHRPEYRTEELPWQARPRQRRAASPGTAREAEENGNSMPLWLLPLPHPLNDKRLVDGRWSIEHGPCRIESGWWDGRDVARDYYVVRTERGSRYWVFRERRAPRQWYVHGVFA